MASFQLDMFNQWSERSIVAACLELGATKVGELSLVELQLMQSARSIPRELLASIVENMGPGEDPLGDVFSSLRSPVARRTLGATYTPVPLVEKMVEAIASHSMPSRIVDPGCGSGRFLLQVARRFPEAQLIGFEIDPLAALMARANLAAAGLSGRSRVVLGDYCTTPLDSCEGSTLFLGNPPYVRHHLLSQNSKDWLVREAKSLGLKASQLAGLHVYFFVATAKKSKPGDLGCFITAAEWLDVNYGSILRDLFLECIGGESITVIEPTALPFADAATTAAVTMFRVGYKPKLIRLARIDSAKDLNSPSIVRNIRRDRLAAATRWGHFTRGAQAIPSDYIELGELCRVHRGAVTGANKVWIAGEHSGYIPEEFLFPTVTRARELFEAGQVLAPEICLKRVIDLPAELDALDIRTKAAIDRFLKFAKAQGADGGYVARNRKAWWSVGLRNPAPILATYMARRAPRFVRNLVAARHINIAHGLYPREPMPSDFLDTLAHYLSRSVDISAGRTYAGGLTKFEPREMERILIPRPEVMKELSIC